MFRLAAVCLFLAAPVMANGVSAGDVVEWPMQTILDGIATLPGPDEEGRPQTTLVIRRDNAGNSVVQFAQTGFADDSVEGARETYVLKPLADGRYEVLETKAEYRCYRGSTPKKWQSDLCP